MRLPFEHAGLELVSQIGLFFDMAPGRKCNPLAIEHEAS
jgi:hypothetical protein